MPESVFELKSVTQSLSLSVRIIKGGGSLHRAEKLKKRDMCCYSVNGLGVTGFSVRGFNETFESSHMETFDSCKFGDTRITFSSTYPRESAGC